MNLARTFTLAALFAAFVGSAAAAPQLRADITVSAPIVTVADMFDDAGLLAERALFRAPLPGTTGLVDLAAVAHAAKLVGITDFDSAGIERVRVSRAAAHVDATMLTGIINNDLRARGIIGGDITADLRFDRSDLAFDAEAVEQPVHLVSLRYAPASGIFTARFQLAGIELPVDVTGRAELMVEAAHLAAPRPAGTVLSPSDIELRRVPLKFAETTGIVRLDQLVGKQLERAGRAGLMLRAADVTEPMVVTRNQMVTVYLRTGPMVLTVKGLALNGAAVGQPVQVMNTTSKKILSGTALPNGGVEMTSVLNVAGL